MSMIERMKRCVFLLSVVMIVLFVAPITANATLYVGSNGVSDNISSGNKWSYDVSTNTLTLQSGFTTSGGGGEIDNPDDTCGIAYYNDNTPLTIVFSGSCSITPQQSSNKLIYGIWSKSAPVIIKGSGAEGDSLTIKSDVSSSTSDKHTHSYGIYAPAVTFESGNISIKAGPATEKSVGIVVPGGSISIKSGVKSLTVEGKTQAIEGSLAGDRNLIITAGESESTAVEKEQYTNEKYARIIPGDIIISTDKTDISPATMSGIVDKYYTGEAITQTPVINLVVEGVTVTLTEGTDYELSYIDNVNTGTATVTATGIGNYTGTISQQFNIIADKDAPEVDLSTLAVSYPDGKTAAQAGDEVTVSVKATDFSGIKLGQNWTSGTCFYYHNSTTGSDRYICATEYDNSTGIITVPVSVTEDTDSGTWVLHQIIAYDGKGNKGYINYYEADLTAGNFVVTGTNPDRTPPTVNLSTLHCVISGGKEKASAGDTVTVTVNASDTSGLRTGGSTSYTYLKYESPIAMAAKYYFVKSYENDVLTFEIPINTNTEYGVWNLKQMVVVDGKDNKAYLNSGEGFDLSAAQFEVVETTPDTTPPVVKLDSLTSSITGERDVAKNGDVVTISFMASDESGLDLTENLTGTCLYYGLPSGDHMYVGKNSYDETSGTVTFVIPVNNETEMGTWRLEQIIVHDSKGNVIYLNYYDEGVDLSAGNFVVADNIMPTIYENAFGIVYPAEQRYVATGQTATISVKVTDNVSVSEVNLTYEAGSREFSIEMAASAERADYFAHIFVPKADTVLGDWVLKSITATDNTGNVRTLSSANSALIRGSDGDFVVKGLLVDDALAISTAEYHYSGNVQKPDAVVTFNGKELTKDTDYTIALKDDAGNAINEPKDPGIYTVEATGIGDYAGIARKTFRILAPHKVTFDTRGGSSIASQDVFHGEKAVKPDDPTREGWRFGNVWYSDAALTTAYDFTTPVMEDITLRADWYTTIAIGIYNESNPERNQYGSVEIETAKQEYCYSNVTTGNYEVPEGTMKFTANPAQGYSFKGWYEGVVGSNGFVVTPSASLLSATAEYVCNAGEAAICAVFECSGHVWGEGTITTQPSCTEPGVKTFVCSRCGTEKTEDVPASGHNWDDGTVTIAPTATTGGVKTYTCSSCNATRTEDLPADAAAKEVIDKISDIGTVTYTDESKAKIDAARQAYNGLTASQQALVTNFSTLSAAESTYAELKGLADQAAADQAAADIVIGKINAIGNVTYTNDSKSKIDAARTAYDSLSSSQKSLVTNYSILTAAETRYDELKIAAENAANQEAIDRATADAVITKINAIGTVVYTDTCKAKIDMARQAYNGLSSTQKALVTNFNTLTAAETKYGELKTDAENAARQAAADRAAADAVIDKINAIGTVSYNDASKAKIDVARQAYNGLSSTQKALVTNTNVLTAAETKYGELKTAVEEDARKKAEEEAAAKKKAEEEAAKKKAAEEAAKKKAEEEKAKQEPITIEKTPASVKAKVKKNKVTVTWKKIKKTRKTKKLLGKIKSIQVQYSTDPSFKKNVINKKLGKKKTKVVLKLQKKKTYYVRVRYVGTNGVSRWSKVKKVQTK